MGYNDFGDFYYSHGALGDAFKSYVRTRDYCTTSKHIIHMCLSAILVSIEMGQFTHVTSYVSKAEQSPEALDPITAAKLRCAAGLAHLEAKKYKLAARKVCWLIYCNTINIKMVLVLACGFNKECTGLENCFVCLLVTRCVVVVVVNVVIVLLLTMIVGDIMH